MRTSAAKSRLSARHYQEGQAILQSITTPKVPCVICGVWVRNHTGTPETACCTHWTCQEEMKKR